MRLVSVTGWVFCKTQNPIQISVLSSSLEISGDFDSQGFSVSPPIAYLSYETPYHRRGDLSRLGKTFT